jgi:hypothetical protein
VILGIVYHMPFWRAADGRLREPKDPLRATSTRSRRIRRDLLCVPVLDRPAGEGTAIRSANVTLAPLPAFDGPLAFYRRLASVLPRLVRWTRRIDLLHCRVPSPAAAFAFAIARLLNRPAFILVVGDLRALLPSMPYRGLKRALWRAYTEFEERNVQRMADRALTFANGAALTAKHTRAGHPVIETITTTIGDRDIAAREDTCVGRGTAVRVLSVSWIDPRKGLRVLPEVVRRLSMPVSTSRSTSSGRSSDRPDVRNRTRSWPRRGDSASPIACGRPAPCRSIVCCRCTPATTCSCCRRCPAKACRACCSNR